LNGANNIIKTLDGNYVFVWANVDSGACCYVYIYHATKIDDHNNIIWTKTYFYSYNENIRVSEFPNGNLLMTGIYNDTISSGTCPFLMICNSNGDSIGKFVFHNYLPVWCYDGIPTSDGGVILTGGSGCCHFSTIENAYTTDMWVLKVDSLGLIGLGINLPKVPLLYANIGNPYPNPTNDKCVIATLVPPLDENGIIENGAFLNLYDMQSKLLKKIPLSIGLNQTIIDMSKYASGEYLCVLSLNGYNAGAKKIIKQ
jgi:hypothetical protein